MSKSICSDCGGTVIEYDQAAGNGFCVSCGTVIEENTIVSEIEFGETSVGAAVVQGSFVAQGSTRARISGPYGNRGNSESREQTIANASKKIQSIANILRLSEHICLSATRLYTLAVEHKFTKGRKSLNVVAVCMYVACRQKETRNYMLIDFSDLLQVNVFELGHTYLQLVQTLNLRLPLVDPSHYISRFAALLEFGEETNKVATDAIRLVSRFDRDWMSRGRRPAGICGAALLLAARMNNFRRSVEEIVQVVKIADTTLKKRLEEFKRTPSGQLTLADFRRVWLDEEMDPPAFTKGREKEEAERKLAEAAMLGHPVDGLLAKDKKRKKGKGKEKERPRDTSGGAQKRKRKQRRVDSDGEVEEDMDGGTPSHPAPPPPLFDPALLSQGILAGTIEPIPSRIDQMPLFAPDPEDEASANINIDPNLLHQAYPTSLAHYSSGGIHNHSPTATTHLHSSLTSIGGIEFSQQEAPPDYVEETISNVIVQEVSKYLGEGRAAQVRAVLDEQEEEDRQRRIEREEERRKRAIAWQEQQEAEDGEEEEDWTLGLDDNELDRFMLSEEEVRIKERVWVELNKDYLEALAAKGEQQDATPSTKSRKRRNKTSTKPRDATTASGSTVTESVQNLVKKNPKYSRRINYDALKELFVESGGLRGLTEGMTTGEDEKDDRELIQMDTIDHQMDDDTEPQLLIVEDGVGPPPPPPPPVVGVGVVGVTVVDGMENVRRLPFDDEDGEGESEDEKELHYAWEDAYEQEI